MRTFFTVLFMGTGILTWYAAIVLFVARFVGFNSRREVRALKGNDLQRKDFRR